MKTILKTKGFIILFVGVCLLQSPMVHGWNPKNIRQNASAVINYYNEVFEISSPKKAQRTIEYEITILRESGAQHGKFVEFYDEFRSVRLKNAEILNAFGQRIKKVRKSDFTDQGITSGYSLYDDNRVVHYQPRINSFPYSVRYEYKISYSGLLSYPSWFPQFAYNVAVKQASLQVVVPGEVGIHHQSKNLEELPAIQKQGSDTHYHWEVKNISARKDEPFAPSFWEVAPQVRLAPDHFEIGGYEGSLQSWNDFGQWNSKLISNRNRLPSSTIREVKNIAEHTKGKHQTIKKLYDYVRSRTRYVSIQLGIGGWQPFDAAKVDELGYGDCKALTNYMKAILEVAAIQSHYTLVRSDPNPFSFDPHFPCNQFNHVVLCVPLRQDTIWLETTSQMTPFGYLGKHASNRQALSITSKSGELVSTPRYHAADNLRVQKASIRISPEGHAYVSSSTSYEGLQYDYFLNQYDRNPKEQERWLYQHLNLTELTIKKISYKRINNQAPCGKRTLVMEADHYAARTGKRMFLPLNQLHPEKQVPKKLNNRQSDILLESSFIKRDSVIFELPKHYKIEHLPKSRRFESRFGTYQVEIKNDGEKIHYIRQLTHLKGIYSKKHYRELRTFYKNIVKSDNLKAVLIKM